MPPSSSKQNNILKKFFIISGR